MVMISGDFTMWKFLKGLQPKDFERTVGFHQGRLSAGFAIVVIDPHEKISEKEFTLGASTRWSNNRVGKNHWKTDAIEDIIRLRDQDPEKLRSKVAIFLNLGGDNAPAKVLPATGHEEWMDYPDADARNIGERNGIPSFKLTVPKKFHVVRVFPPNYQ